MASRIISRVGFAWECKLSALLSIYESVSNFPRHRYLILALAFYVYPDDTTGDALIAN
jgi:hypothetical protein